MWFLILIACVALPSAAFALVRRRRRRDRDRRMILGEMRALVRLLDEPAADPPIRFTYPHRCDEDRAHDTMFIASRGGTRLSFILDTSRMRIRWWVLYELYAPEESGAKRTLRVEATFIEGAIPIDSIRPLLAAARGDAPPPPAAPEPKGEDRVDPFEAPSPDPSAPAVQAPSPIASATGD